MSYAPAQIAASSPLAVRTVFFSVTVVLMLFVLSTGSVGGQTADDHGDRFSTATNLSLGSSIKGRIDPADDQDMFRLDLSGRSGTTDVWIYTTGHLDTVGYLFDGRGNRLLANDDSRIINRWSSFHLRASLTPGIYYVAVISLLKQHIGDYTLHAEAVTDIGNAIDTAPRLSLDVPTPGAIGSQNDADYFRLEFTETTDVVVYAKNPILFRYVDFQNTWSRLPLEPLEVQVFDSRGKEITINVYPEPRVGQADGFEIRDDFGPGTYYVKISAPTDVTKYPVPYTIHSFEDVRYTDFIDECEAKTSQLNAPSINDALYACQWHLDHPSQIDINVEPVWEEGIMGEDVNVAVVDDGMYYTHEDLKENVDTSRNHDYTGNEDIYIPLEHHGTHVAGLIAAKDNGIGVRGVAPRATVYGYNYLVESTDLNRADAMTRNRDVTAVSNNSWGPIDGPWLGRANAFWEFAIESGITDGYDGKGVFYVFAGGNGGAGHRLNSDGTLMGGNITNAIGTGDDSNLDELANFYGVTAVCAVNDHGDRSGFSEKGANLWVCAPSNDLSHPHLGILTTENSDRYYEEFGGTSASTPIVAGVAALVRGANPDLTWRDVKLILAGSARKNDPHNPGWEDGATVYRSDAEDDRYHFNHEYGFGVVDAKAAVDLAKKWTRVPALMSDSEMSAAPITIPAPGLNGPETVTSELTLNTGIRFTEFVEINANFSHTSFRDMEIELESPSGAVSKLAVPFNTRHYWHLVNGIPTTLFVHLDGTIRLGSARHLGEDPNGAWKLRLTDHYPLRGGTLRSWQIKVYGHENPPGPPSVYSVTPGLGTLKVAWDAPEETGSSPVVAYDLRYIQSDSDAGEDSNWTVVEDVWTSRSGGDLEYLITSLVGGVPYNVQVRAENRAGGGPWSGTGVGTPTQVTTGACGTSGAVSDATNNPELVSDCNALLAARDALAGRASLNWSENTPIVDWQGVTVGGTPRRITELSLHDTNLTGAIPTELGRLTKLERLTLSRNQLTGTIPTWISNLSELEELLLWGNKLSGPIPNSVGDLVDLEELYLSQNQLSGPIPTSLGNLVNLQELSLWRNELTGPLPVELGSLAKLQRLVVSNNQLSGPLPAWLGELANLRALSLWGNRLTGKIPSEFEGLTNLSELYLSQNQLTGSIPASLGSLGNLKVLSLWQNQLTGSIPEELGNLSGLESLLLRENLLTGAIPSSLGDLESLEQLTLRQNQLSGCVPEGLRNVASNDLDELDLPSCDVVLSGLVVSPGTLVQPFEPHKTDYTALSDASRVTVTPVTENNATVVLLDRHNRLLEDADASRDGHQVDLDQTTTIILIKVTSVDGLSTFYYTLSVRRVPSAPALKEVRSGERELLVSWTPPARNGGSDIIAYDIRYIRTVVDETQESDWTVVENAWTSSSSGNLEYAITGLTGSTQYDVQVRAVNNTAAGFWSVSVTGTTAPSICEINGAVKDSANTGLISDCEVLLAARDTLAGSVPINWSAGTPIGQWEGVRLRGTPQRVTRLDLSYKGLDGTIPSELGRLEMLAHLNLRSNNLTGPIPASLGSLTSLTYLNLHSNDLSGGIPDLSRISGLEELYLARNADHDKDGSKVQGTGLTGRIPTWLNDMTDMRELWLWGNSLSGSIPDLSGMTSLKRLKLANNRLTGRVPEASRLPPNLTWLIIDRNPLGGGVPDLSSLTSLKLLWLHSNRLTGAVPTGDKFPTGLDDLNLRDNMLTGTIPDLGNLDNLTRLRLHNNSLDGEVPATLGGLDSLKHLWLHNEDATKTDYGNNSFTGIAAGVGDLSDTLIEIALRGNSWSADACVPSALRNVATNDYEEAGLTICP